MVNGRNDTPVFYNTTRLTGVELYRHEDHALTQERRVLSFFRDNPERRIGVDYVRRMVLNGCQYSSAQRSVSNLTSLGHLEKSGHTVAGPNGSPIHVWSYVRG